MSKYPPFEHTADYWKARHTALANKIYRQQLYYQSVSSSLKTQVKEGLVSPRAVESLEAMTVQLDKAASDMEFIFTKACAGLPPVEVLRITTPTQ